MSPALACRDLRVEGGARQLLHVPHLEVDAGSCLAVLGPNGAGKSTLLRALGLLSRHRVSGEVLLDGAPATPAGARTATAAVLQRPILRRGTVAANVASGLRFRGAGAAEAAERSRPWLAALGLDHLADRDVRSLSGGEAQRACIARALATEPAVLLLDEPFAGLDAPTRADLLADLRSALSGRSLAVVLVTHDVDEARALADTTALLIQGQVRHHGPTAEVLDTPVDLDTARLLGFVNHLPSALTGRPGEHVARPEHCVAHRSAAPPAALIVPGVVRRRIPLGPLTRIDVHVSTGLLTCLHPTGDAGGDAPGDGEAVLVEIRQSRELPSDRSS